MTWPPAAERALGREKIDMLACAALPVTAATVGVGIAGAAAFCLAEVDKDSIRVSKWGQSSNLYAIDTWTKQKSHACTSPVDQ
jgi:hypothetical protein